MKTFIRLIVSIMTISAISQAQVAEYYFTQQNLSYSEITGGVELWSTAFDNEVSGEISIPSFTYDGTAYTSMYVSANGFITFGAAPAATNYTPVSSTATYAGCVSAFGRDVNQAASGAPSVRYEQVGNEFVIQWKDVRRKDISGEIISFQIRLNTSNNNILIVYGGTITPGSNTTYPQVGLRGPDNTLATNIHNRTIASSGGNWINSTRGTGITNTMYFNSATPATVPSPGLTYTFKPLYNPLNFTSTGVSLSQIDLSWQKNSLNHNVMLAFNTSNNFGTPESGQVYSAGNTFMDGGTVLFYGNGTSFSHTGLNPNMVYYYKIWSYDAVPDYSPGATTSTRTAYALPYLQAFPSSSLPAEWLSDMSRSNLHGTSGTYGLYKRLYSSATTAYATAPLAGSITANSYLSFHYRFVDYLGFPYVATTLGVNDKLEIQVSTDDGATFTTFHTIDYTNHTATTVFTNKAVSLAAYAGDFIRIKFLCTWESGDYYFDLDNVLIEDGTDMSYTSNTVEQPNLSNVAINSTDNDIIRLEVITQKSANPLSVTSITFNTTGCTSVGNDVAAAKVFFTTTPVFSTSTQFGSSLSNPSGTFTITGSQELAQGNNYFWLAYDIKSTATLGNVVDGQCTKFITSESVSDKLTNKTAITGNRKIGAVVNGVKTIPGDYAIDRDTVTELNSGVIGPDGVTVNVAAGHLESITAPIVLTATGSSTQPIIFQQSGTGNNPLVTHTGAGTVSTSTIGYNGDAVIIIEGGDYITFESIDVAAQQQGVEYGYYIRKFSVTDGCKHVAIKNATITMVKGSSRYVVGICAGNNSASGNNITIASPDGSHDYITLTGNSISNVFCGMYFRGSADFYDQAFTVGSSGYGNTIQNFGGNSANETWGIYLINNKNSQFRYNTINNLTGNSGGFLAAATGIYNAITTDYNFTAEYNNINLTSVSSQLYGIYNSSMGLLNLNNNTIALSNTAASTAVYVFIYNTQTFTATTSDTYITNNIFAASSFQATGQTFMIRNSNNKLQPSVSYIQNNLTSGTIDRTGGSGAFWIYYNDNTSGTGTENISGNSFSNIVLAGSSQLWGIYSTTKAEHTQNVYNNTISGITLATGTFTGIHLTNADNRSVYGNKVFNITTGGPINGIYLGSGSNPGHIYKNELYNISSSSTLTTDGLVNGIQVIGGTNVYLYNNFISDLKTPQSPGADAIRGIAITSSVTNSTIGVYYNTIYLDATSTGTNFGTSGIYQLATSTPTTAMLDLRNNIIINNSTPNGNYSTVAFRRNTTTLANYAATSNNNIFYAGTPGTYRLIYWGNTSKQTIEEYRTYVGPNRDSVSFSELPPFVNITTAPYNLRLQDGQLSYCESGAQSITTPISITDDFDGNTRTVARSSQPDIGADEFAGIAAYVEFPSSLTASVLNSQQVSLAFSSNTENDDVVIVYKNSSAFSDPVGTPVVGEPLAGGTVVYVGTASPVIHSGLTPNAVAYYKAFCYNGSNYSLGITANATPTVTPVTDLTALPVFQTIINLGWTKNIYDHDVMVANHSAYMNGNPVNGTNYNVGDPLPVSGTVIYKGPASGYSHTGLDSWSQHYYKVWSVDIYNYYSSGVSTNAITDADPVATFPFLQNFDGTWSHSPEAPQNWQVVDVGGSGSFTWLQDNVLSHSGYYSARGKGNGACNDYLISPPLLLPDTAIRLTWWDIVSNAASNNSYKVLLSTTNNQISSFTTELGDYNCTNTAWTMHTLDLSAYKGQDIYIAFYQYYSQSQYDYFSIDDILIETLIPGSAVIDFPLNELLTMTDLSLKWKAPYSSEPITGYKVYLSTDPDPSALIYDGPDLNFSVIDLTYNTDYYWKVIPYNLHGEADNVPVWTFTTVTNTQLAESFVADYFPPVSWSAVSWYQDEANSIDGDKTARRYTNPDIRPPLVTPLLAIESGDKLEFFEGTATKINNFIRITYSTDKTTWTQLGEVIYVTIGAWGHQVIDLTPLAGNNYYLAIEAWCALNYNAYVYIDHVTGPDIVPVLPAMATNPGPADSVGYISISTQLSWDPTINGGIPSGYRVYLDENPVPATLIYNGPTDACPAGSLDFNTVYYWKVVPYNSVGDAINCPVWSFTTAPEGWVQIGRDQSDLDLPLQPYYQYNYTQSIYLQSEINMEDKRIESIFYYWNGGEEGFTYKDWVIYMGHTTKTAFASTSDWVPSAQMTKVFDGEVWIPAIEGWVEIILDLPYDYNNEDNLVIAVDENSPGYSGSESAFFYNTYSTENRSIRYYDDDVNPDPQSPPVADYLVDGFANLLLQMEDLPTGPIFRIDPTSKDYGVILLDNESNPQSFKIRNRGIGTLTINGVEITGSDAGQFNLTDPNLYPMALAANEWTEVSVTFNPTTEGQKIAALAISHSLIGSPGLAALSGNGLDATVDDFPYTETFENDSPTRTFWTQIQEVGNGSWTYAEGAGSGSILTAHSGALNARFLDLGSGYKTKLVSPLFDLTGLPDPYVTFWYGQEDWSGDQNELKVFYRTASDQPWVEIFWDTYDRYEWTYQELELPNPSATYQLAFEAYDDYGYANVLDDVTVGPPPAPVTTWHGSVSTNWLDPDNWSDGVPTVDHAVIIDSQNFDPIINTSVTVFSVDIQAGSVVTVTSTGILTVTGN